MHFLEGSMHPLVLLFFRSFVACILLLPLTTHFWRDLHPTFTSWKYIARLLLNVVALGFYFWSLTLLNVAIVVAVHFTAPLFALLFRVLLLHESVRKRSAIAILVNLVGLVLIASTRTTDSALGMTLALLAAATWGAAIVVLRRLSIGGGALLVD